MSGPIRFGRRLTISRTGDLVTQTEEIYSNFDTVKRVTVMVDTVRVKDEKDILAEFLRLLDRQKAGEIDQIGIQILRDSQGNLRVEKSWVVP